MQRVVRTNGGGLLIILLAGILIVFSAKPEISARGIVPGLAIGLIIVAFIHLFAYQPDRFVNWKLVPKDEVGNISILGYTIGIGLGLCLVTTLCLVLMN